MNFFRRQLSSNKDKEAGVKNVVKPSPLKMKNFAYMGGSADRGASLPNLQESLSYLKKGVLANGLGPGA